MNYTKKNKPLFADVITEAVTTTIPSLRIRKNINSIKPNDDKLKLLKTAIEKSIETGEYAKLVTYHSQLMYTIHSFESINQRFLPWHRVYLIKFEEMLDTVMKKENPDKDYNIAIPYWDWEHDHAIPDFFKDLMPKMDVKVYLWAGSSRPLGSKVFSLKVKRFTEKDSNQWPTESQITQIKQNNKFKDFFIDLENGPHGT